MAEPDGPTFGGLLRPHRLAAHLTQEELAERAQLSRRAVQELERGTRLRPSVATVRALADALDLDPRSRASLEAAARSAQTPSLTSKPPSVRRELPVPLTSFIGRERELAEVSRLVRAVRLVTLIGAGGVGKTRLALQVAAMLSEEFPDGVALVELAGLEDPALVADVVAAELGIPEQPGRLALDVLTESLRNQELLLVLDNCEHLVGACTTLADQLLRICPKLRVLATSRQILAVGGEAAWRVPSLTLPEPLTRLLHQVLRSEAAQLFVERAQAVLPSFAPTESNASGIVQLCRRLEGIPLALELAAAWVTVISVDQIAGRLDDALRLLVSANQVATPRQQTLRATIDWSYRLLSGPEQRLFERLSIFAGGWTLQAAEAVCAGRGIVIDAVLGLMRELVTKSLVLAQPESSSPYRYQLLEVVRQYAAGRAPSARR